MINAVAYENQIKIPVSLIKPQLKFPTLKIVPIEKLIPHELFDTTRTIALHNRLLEDGVLRNPPVVAPLQGDMGNYMVLDGANRTNALKMMDVPHILVQVASPGDTGFELSAWNQVVLGIRPDELLSILKGITEVSLINENEMRLPLEDGYGVSVLIRVHLPSRQQYSIITGSIDIQARTQILNIILERIRKYARLDRTHHNDHDRLRDLYPDLAGLIEFPCYEFDEIVELAESRQMIPAGITRFLISPRALRVNYRISDLRSDRSLTEKNENLMRWTQERVSQKGVRVYNETTIMFDE